MRLLNDSDLMVGFALFGFAFRFLFFLVCLGVEGFVDELRFFHYIFINLLFLYDWRKSEGVMAKNIGRNITGRYLVTESIV